MWVLEVQGGRVRTGGNVHAAGQHPPTLRVKGRTGAHSIHAPTVTASLTTVRWQQGVRTPEVRLPSTKPSFTKVGYWVLRPRQYLAQEAWGGGGGEGAKRRTNCALH